MRQTGLESAPSETCQEDMRGMLAATLAKTHDKQDTAGVHGRRAAKWARGTVQYHWARRANRQSPRQEACA